MKPLKLSIQAFGPFSSRQVIDFTLLGTNPLFLINGQTGSGKTSILDAICFALYGQTTGNEREPSQMRCDYTDESLLTEIELDFKLGENSYRIRRMPTQERPKSRGDGTTTQQAEAKLWQLDESSEGFYEGRLIVPKSVAEANSEIKTLLGLEVEQFRQVMVLPQGQFRKLLIADSKDREKIFAKLFQTQIYKRIEDQLKDKSSEIKRAVDDHQNQIKGILQTAEVNTEDQAEEELESLISELEEALKNKEQAQKQQTAALANKDQALALIAGFTNLSKKESELTDKLKYKEEIDSNQKRLNKAITAEKIRHIYNNQQAQSVTFENLNQELEQSIKSFEQASEENKNADELFKEASEAHQAVDDLKIQQVELQKLEGRIEELTKERNELKDSDLALNKSCEALDVQKEEQQALIDEQLIKENLFAEIGKELSSLVEKQVLLEKQRQQVEQRKSLEALKTDRTNLEQKETKQQKKLEKREIEFKTAETETTKTELAWHRGQAALLATELKEDEPCPVCGSKDHPQPASTDTDNTLVTKQQVEDARNKEDVARSSMQEAKNEMSNTQSELKNNQKEINKLEKQLEDLSKQSVEAVSNLFSTTEKEVKFLLDQQVKQKEAGDRVSVIKSSLSGINKILIDLDTQKNSDNEKLFSSKSNVDQLEKLIPEKYRDLQYLTNALSELNTKIESLTDGLANAQNQLDEKRTLLATATANKKSFTKQCANQEKEYTNSKTTWSSTLTESDFDNLDAFNRALLSDEEKQSIKDEVETYRSELKILEGAVKQLKSDLKDKTQPDLDVIEEQLTEKTALFKAVDEVWRKFEERNNLLISVQKKLTIAHETNAELEAQYAIFGTLSDVANGKTGNKISLQRFVLSVLLDDVLIQASQRLIRMSKGRYQLIRSDDRVKGNKASGLELEVEDAYYGTSRSVATLSGGESFMAALSLALGLSDVVQSYAGGIKLDTLFIDEGFGSLDSESLELAINTLIDLQASGRTIGIISHVSELKEQMTKRLDVVSSHGGSSVRTIAS